MSQAHISTMMEAGVILGKVKGDPFEHDVRVTLDDKDLWEKFRILTNEMIVTKTGRYVGTPISYINESGEAQCTIQLIFFTIRMIMKTTR